MPLFSSQRSVSGVFSARKKSGGILPYLTRQVITTGYVAGGYKDGVAWRNVNKLNQSNDTTSNLGDLMQEAGNYTKGAQTKDKAYIFGTNGTGTQGVGEYTSTSTFSMRTDTTAAKAMNSSTAIGDGSTIQATDTQGNYTFAYFNGNNTGGFARKYNMATESDVGTVGSSLYQGGTGAGAHWEENHGYWWDDTNSSRKLVFSTETETTPGASPGFHGQQKGLVAKTGFGYGGNEGTYGSGRYFRKWNYTTEITQSTPQKPVWFCGEENYVAGQTAGYLLGHYSDTAGGNASAQGQTNDSGKFTYATDSGFRGAFDPTGTSSGAGSNGAAIGGRSSGVPFWRD